MIEIELKKGTPVGYKGRLARVREVIDEEQAIIEYAEVIHAASGKLENPVVTVLINDLTRLVSKNEPAKIVKSKNVSDLPTG